MSRTEDDYEMGVDGNPLVEAEDEAEVERRKAAEALTRNRAYLGREFLTWLVFRSNDTHPIEVFEEHPIVVLIVGQVRLSGLAGDATELAVKGRLSAYSEVVRHAIDQGLLVHAARIRIQHGEQVFEATLDAEYLTVRSAEVPKVLSEEDDDRLTERLWLCERLGALLDALWARFVEVRTAPKWKEEVQKIKSWANVQDDR